MRQAIELRYKPNLVCNCVRVLKELGNVGAGPLSSPIKGLGSVGRFLLTEGETVLFQFTGGVWGKMWETKHEGMGIGHLCRKPVPGFVHPLTEELIIHVRSEPR